MICTGVAHAAWPTWPLVAAGLSSWPGDVRVCRGRFRPCSGVNGTLSDSAATGVCSADAWSRSLRMDDRAAAEHRVDELGGEFMGCAVQQPGCVGVPHPRMQVWRTHFDADSVPDHQVRTRGSGRSPPGVARRCPGYSCTITTCCRRRTSCWLPPSRFAHPGDGRGAGPPRRSRRPQPAAPGQASAHRAYALMPHWFGVGSSTAPYTRVVVGGRAVDPWSVVAD